MRILYQHYRNVLEYSLRLSHADTHDAVFARVFELLPRLCGVKQQQAAIIGKFQPNLPPSESLDAIAVGNDRHFVLALHGI